MIMSCAMSVFAVILIYMGIQRYLEARKSVSRIDMKTMGYVTDIEEEQSDKNGVIYRMIYAADINGASVMFHDLYYRKRRKEIGTPVNIRYEDGNYCNFTADRIDQRYQIPLSFCGMGLVFAILAVITYIKFG